MASASINKNWRPKLKTVIECAMNQEPGWEGTITIGDESIIVRRIAGELPPVPLELKPSKRSSRKCPHCGKSL